jgi:hypothetical protein
MSGRAQWTPDLPPHSHSSLHHPAPLCSPVSNNFYTLSRSLRDENNGVYFELKGFLKKIKKQPHKESLHLKLTVNVQRFPSGTEIMASNYIVFGITYLWNP